MWARPLRATRAPRRARPTSPYEFADRHARAERARDATAIVDEAHGASLDGSHPVSFKRRCSALNSRGCTPTTGNRTLRRGVSGHSRWEESDAIASAVRLDSRSALPCRRDPRGRQTDVRRGAYQRTRTWRTWRTHRRSRHSGNGRVGDRPSQRSRLRDGRLDRRARPHRCRTRSGLRRALLLRPRAEQAASDRPAGAVSLRQGRSGHLHVAGAAARGPASMSITAGWYRSSAAFFDFLVDQGLPETNPMVAADRASDPDTAPASGFRSWIALAFAAVVALSVVSPRLRRRVLAVAHR